MIKTVDRRRGFMKKKQPTEAARKKSTFRSSKKWKNWRIYMLEKQDYTCFMSGFKRKKGLQVHHCDPDNYEDLKEEKFLVLTNAEHRLLERLLSRKDFNIDLYCKNLKTAYKRSKK